MRLTSMVPLSVLDLAPVRAGLTATDALREAVDLARHTERLGYHALLVRRASRHGQHRQLGAGDPDRAHRLGDDAAFASARAASCCRTTRRCAWPKRSTRSRRCIPGRIDLGLGRAPGTDPATSRALRPFDGEQFPDQVRELLALSRRTFPAEHPFGSVRVVPTDVRAAADLGARLERGDGRVRRARSAWATASRGTSARIRRRRRFARIASTSCRRRSSRRRT